ncbi:MAG: iron ABC transporter permease [Treponema sp.]|jgi:iron complex transport system permease protein|nr:iron ABC transporter permease [Treponema sp.]
MKTSVKFIIGGLCALAILCIGASLGSSRISVFDTIRIILHKILSLTLSQNSAAQNAAIVWNLRLPRAILAFITGGALSISGAVFQSVLKNQLASPYILGVSSGASLGAGIVILSGFAIPFIGGFTLPAAGFVFGVITVFIVVAFSSKIDKTLSNNTIILFGMVFSLFVNAILTTLTALYREELKNLLYWQMGSFSLKGWSYVALLLPFLIVGSLGIFRYTRELDILTFGDEQAKSIGVNTRGMRIKLLVFSAILTGSAVALSGAIGFVDLIAPHAARRIVGSKHKYVLPMSFLIGGALLVASDLIARTVVSPSELPVGAVTALIGGPFFAWVYFRKKGN